MPITKSAVRRENPADDASVGVSSACGVKAHLRMLPREPGEFRVVVTFHNGDGVLCQAELKPAEASELGAEIARAIDQGGAIAPDAPLAGERSARCD